MHDQMRKNEDKYAAVEDPEGTSREIGITAIKVQDMQAKRCVVGFSLPVNALRADYLTSQDQQLYI
jgi:hypothetical protein